MSTVNIIIPVYNTEDYLSELFDSIIAQTYQDYRLFVVNDCSTDNSEDVIASYQTRFDGKMIYVRNDHNIKLGMTRNRGLDEAEKYPSKYIAFLDSDDWIEPDYLKSMIDLAEKTDAGIVVCGIERFEDKTGNVLCDEAVNGKRVSIKDDVNMYELAYINPAAYNKLYRSELLQGFRYKPLLRSEDTCYLFDILQNVETIEFTNKIGYHYRVREDSLTGTVMWNVCESMMTGFSELFAKLEKVPITYRAELETQAFIRIACGGVSRASFQNMKNVNTYVNKTKEYFDKTMPSWRKNEYLSLGLNNSSLKAFFLRICALLYKMGMYGVFVRTYYIMLKVLKKEVRV